MQANSTAAKFHLERVEAEVYGILFEKTVSEAKADLMEMEDGGASSQGTRK